MDIRKRYNGFTLSEVLITLSILGVVAALTIPSIHRKWQDAYTVAAVKKAYSTLDSALQQMYVIEGPFDRWVVSTSQATRKTQFANKLANYLKYSKYCAAGPNTACAYPGSNQNTRFKILSLSESGQYIENTDGGGPNFVLNDGMRIWVQGVGECSNGTPYCWGNYGTFRVDINGKKGPNRYGYDVFFFPFGPKSKDGIVMKYRESTAYYNDCKSPNEKGRSCAPWVLQHGNLDYKYRNVSAEW